MSRRAGGSQLRVLIGPENVADQGPALAMALRGLGVDARSICVAQHPFYPAADVQGAATSRLQLLRQSAITFSRLARDVDVVHFQSSSFLPPIHSRVPWTIESAYLGVAVEQIRRLRRGGRIAAVTFHGDDIRPTGEIIQRWEAPHEILVQAEYEAELRERRIRYSTALARECDLRFVTTPDLLDHIPGGILAPALASRAFAAEAARGPEAWAPLAERREGVLHVLHAPSSMAVKGSRQILDAVADARSRGMPVALRTVTGASIRQVIAAVQESDLVIDQVRIGWYGTFAVEAMALGRPALARLDPDYLKRFQSETGILSGQMGPLSCTSHAIVDTLDVLARASSAEWAGLVDRTRAFYAAVHSPETVAELVLGHYMRALSAAR